MNSFLNRGCAKSRRLRGELADLLHRLVVREPEGQHRVGHGAVGHLLVDVERVPAPVAARVHRVRGVDHHLGAAAAARSSVMTSSSDEIVLAHRRR